MVIFDILALVVLGSLVYACVALMLAVIIYVFRKQH